MNCPKCVGAVLRPMSVKGVEVDHCPDCGGIWFDPAELGALLELDSSSLRPLTGGAANPQANTQAARCPRDATPMIRVASARKRTVILDTCPRCRGLWLDGGELAELLAR
jgi:Zn-finger nucleic acid-binding protein